MKLRQFMDTEDKTELLINPFLRAYKDDPRFSAFAQKIGVMPKTGPKP